MQRELIVPFEMDFSLIKINRGTLIFFCMIFRTFAMFTMQLVNVKIIVIAILW